MGSCSLEPKVVDARGRALGGSDVPEVCRYLRGCVRAEVQDDGYVRPWRFSGRQLRHLAKVGRGHRAGATAGVCLAFVTDGSEVQVDLEVVFDLAHDADIVREVRAAEGRPLAPEAGLVDSVTLEAAGVQHVATVESGTLTFRLDNDAHVPLECRVWLPYIMAVAVGGLRTDGSLDPMPDRPLLLTLGDSITQGFVAGCSGETWPVRLGRDLDFCLVNQGVAGHVFDPGTLKGSGRLHRAAPAAVVVAYGTNDWARISSAKRIRRNIREYLRRVAELYGACARVYVVSPLWRADADIASASGKPLGWVGQILRDECAELGFSFIDGFDLVPHDPRFFGDLRLHPNAEGSASMARSLAARIRSDIASGPVTDPETGLSAAATAADDQSRARDGAPGDHPGFDALVRTIWRLRQPDGCPWDREQTHGSIQRNMVEEAYEAVDAIDGGDPRHLAEELGDVLMQVLLHAQIADDAGAFSIDDVVAGLDEKLVRRHPHVFGDAAAADEGEVLAIWEQVKDAEREGADQGLLDSVPRSLPALMECQKVSKRAARAGFDWPSADAVWGKVAEERAEFEAEEPGSEAAELEFGDVLFALVNVARKEGVDAERALRRSTAKFRRRWAAMERAAREAGTPLEELSHEELEGLWARAKEGEQEAR